MEVEARVSVLAANVAEVQESGPVALQELGDIASRFLQAIAEKWPGLGQHGSSLEEI